jgi:hypothetical protein
MGVAARNVRHHGGIGNAQARDPMDSAVGIDNGRRIARPSHSACAADMIGPDDCASDVIAQARFVFAEGVDEAHLGQTLEKGPAHCGPQIEAPGYQPWQKRVPAG